MNRLVLKQLNLLERRALLNKRILTQIPSRSLSMSSSIANKRLTQTKNWLSASAKKVHFSFFLLWSIDMTNVLDLDVYLHFVYFWLRSISSKTKQYQLSRFNSPIS
jgi:hypothetical protein